MTYLLWPVVRVVALILLLLLTFSSFMRLLLRGIGGADQVPPSPLGCLIQFIMLPLFLPVILLYYASHRAYLETMVLDVKLGFASPDEAFDSAMQALQSSPLHLSPSREQLFYWHKRFYGSESQD
jgi:hypothetical protein